MKILFDNGTPNTLSRSLSGHEISFARKIGWHELKLIQKVEEAGYDLLLTTDKNIRYQQNLKGRTIAILVLGNQQWPEVKVHIERIVEAVEAVVPGSYAEVEIPRRG